MNPQILNIIGLVLDLFGAIFIGVEVIKPMKGERYESKGIECGETSTPIQTNSFSNWAEFRSRWMIRGLVLLGVGFIIQISSNCIQYFEARHINAHTTQKLTDIPASPAHIPMNDPRTAMEIPNTIHSPITNNVE